MMISNIIKTTQEIESDHSKGDNTHKKGSGEVGGKVGLEPLNLNLFNFTGGVKGETGSSNSTSERSKFIETFEVRATKSVILNDVIARANEIIDTSNLEEASEGNLVKLNNLQLKLHNEEDVRTAKLISTGGLKGIEIPEFKGMDMESTMNAMLKDYSYKIETSIEKEKVIFKIPISYENEFESNYSINDLLIGRVSIVGIYKGKVKEGELEDTMNYFTRKGHNEEEKSNKIQSSTYDSTEPSQKAKSNNAFHYIDLLAVIQTLNVGKEEN